MSEHENFIHDRYGWCYYDLTPGRIPLVYGLYVERDYRRQGHATRLLRMVTQAIRDTGYDGPIEVDARPGEGSVNRDVLVSFYVRMGLTVRGGDHE